MEKEYENLVNLVDGGRDAAEIIWICDFTKWALKDQNIYFLNL